MNPLLNTPNGTTFNCIIFFVLTNTYSHPYKEILERLEIVGAKVVVTTEHGEIIVGKEKKIEKYNHKSEK